jgi:hypothetical protein
MKKKLFTKTILLFLSSNFLFSNNVYAVVPSEILPNAFYDGTPLSLGSPVKEGTWNLTQGYNGITHKCYGNFFNSDPACDTYALDIQAQNCLKWEKNTEGKTVCTQFAGDDLKKVISVLDGEVAEVKKDGSSTSYGNTVIINHGVIEKSETTNNGIVTTDIIEVYSRSSHLKSISDTVTKGVKLSKGDEIGIQGKTSRDSISEHLHFAIYKVVTTTINGKTPVKSTYAAKPEPLSQITGFPNDKDVIIYPTPNFQYTAVNGVLTSIIPVVNSGNTTPDISWKKSYITYNGIDDSSDPPKVKIGDAFSSVWEFYADKDLSNYKLVSCQTNPNLKGDQSIEELYDSTKNKKYYKFSISMIAPKECGVPNGCKEKWKLVDSNGGATQFTCNANAPLYASVLATDTTSSTSTPTDSPVVSEQQPCFSDVSKDDKAFTAVQYLCTATLIDGEKIVKGLKDGTFGINQNIRRDEFTKIVINVADYTGKLENIACEKKANESFFSDVPDNVWFYNFVKTARDKCILDGYKEGYKCSDSDKLNGTKFCPANDITKAEAAKILVNTLVENVPNGSGTWYLPHVSKLCDLNKDLCNIIGDKPDKTKLTRGEMAILVYNLRDVK